MRQRITRCSNCGWNLSEENIRLAIEDYSSSPLSEEEMDHLSFCCPSYSDEEGCKGYSRDDRALPAYWIYRG